MFLVLQYLILAAALASLININIVKALGYLFRIVSYMMDTITYSLYAVYLDATPEYLTTYVPMMRAQLSLEWYFVELIIKRKLAPFVLLLLGGILVTAICDLLLWVFRIPRYCWKTIRVSPLLLTGIVLAIPVIDRVFLL